MGRKPEETMSLYQVASLVADSDMPCDIFFRGADYVNSGIPPGFLLMHQIFTVTMTYCRREKVLLISITENKRHDTVDER